MQDNTLTSRDLLQDILLVGPGGFHRCRVFGPASISTQFSRMPTFYPRPPLSGSGDVVAI
jgi:hypothetical protein